MCTYNQLLSGATSKGCVRLTLSVTVSRASRALSASAATHVVRVVCVVFGVPLPYTYTFSSWSTLLHMVLCD